jgi:repressor LexA
MSLKQSSSLQQQIYQFIVNYIKKNQKPPTIREIGHAMGISSTGHIDHHLTALEKKGVIEREARKSRAIKLTKPQIGIPIGGTIAAGTPINIFPDVLEFLSVDSALQDEEVFALIVRGQSMIDDHICDGDYVIIKPQLTCQNGDIVVATHMQDGVSGSATLKRFFQENDQVRLQPANVEMDPILIPQQVWDSEWGVQGKIVSIHRQY